MGNIKALPMCVAAEYLKYWKVKTTYARQGGPQQVRHTYYIYAWAKLCGLKALMDGAVTRLLLELGSTAKPRPPGRTTQERNTQCSLERLLRSARIASEWSTEGAESASSE